MSATPSARGWRGYRSDNEELTEVPALAFYCPSCGKAESDHAGAAGPEISRGRRWRDAHAVNGTTFRIALAPAGDATVADGELVSAVDALFAVGGSDISELGVEQTGPPRLEFGLEAQNRGHAMRLAFEVLKALNNATPSLAAGWVLASVIAA